MYILARPRGHHVFVWVIGLPPPPPPSPLPPPHPPSPPRRMMSFRMGSGGGVQIFFLKEADRIWTLWMTFFDKR